MYIPKKRKMDNWHPKFGEIYFYIPQTIKEILLELQIVRYSQGWDYESIARRNIQMGIKF